MTVYSMSVLEYVAHSQSAVIENDRLIWWKVYVLILKFDKQNIITKQTSLLTNKLNQIPFQKEKKQFFVQLTTVVYY